jgi:2-keto-4-pentenoate hydratase
MLGEAASANWREIDLSAFPVQAVRTRNGVEEHRAGVGSNVLGDPRVALTWIANELSGMGVTLKAGEVVTTGTCMVPIEVLPGDRVTADCGAFGTISARFTA